MLFKSKDKSISIMHTKNKELSVVDIKNKNQTLKISNRCQNATKFFMLVFIRLQ